MNKEESALPTNADVEKFEYISPMLNSALNEMRAFAAKKQDGIVSATKIKILNRILTDVKEIVSREKTSAYLDILSDEELPQNSDAVLILGQFRSALDSFEESHYRYLRSEGGKVWFTKEYFEDIAAAARLDAEDEGEETETEP